MQQYPNFYPQFNNYGNMNPNPYIDRISQLQQYQQPMPQITQVSGTNQQMNIIGKIVDSIDAVKATDVPMDGNMYYFPKADGTEIFSKQWLANGQTRILAFKPVLDEEPNNVPNAGKKLKIGLSDESTEIFMKRFDELENKISNFEQSLTKSLTKSSTSRSKKEADIE